MELRRSRRSIGGSERLSRLIAGAPAAIPDGMAISSLMRRLGFVKLDAYGLVLTPEDRILSVRSTVLDDGLGQKIVGWQESDLAAMELERWAPPAAPRNVPKPVMNQVALAPTVPQPAMAPAMPPPIPRAKPPTTPPALTQRPLPGMTTAPARPVAVAQPLGTTAPKQARPPTPIPLETMPMGRVADPTEVGEDEWEWEIAVARARAAAEWAEEAAQQLAAAPVLPRAMKKRATSPIAIVAEAKRDAMKSDIWPTTEPLQRVVAEAIEEPAPPIRVMPRVKSPTPAKPIVMIPTHTPAPLPPPPTGPVSTLTMLPSVSPRAPLQPIVAPRARSTTGQLPAMAVTSSQRRFPRGTPATTPDARMDRIGEDTQVSATPAPAPFAASANDDATRPGLMLPSASSTRRVAAKQR
jgi:hypothetical protein